jgi:transcriptional regulator with XRE-family HTH domain
MGKARFGEMIKEARVDAGLSLREVAAKTGIDFTRLSRIEHGSRPAPGLSEIRILADLLNLDMVDLLVAAGTSREVMEHLLWSFPRIPSTCECWRERAHAAGLPWGGNC